MAGRMSSVTCPESRRLQEEPERLRLSKWYSEQHLSRCFGESLLLIGLGERDASLTNLTKTHLEMV